jgi:hypothetical protein
MRKSASKYDEFIKAARRAERTARVADLADGRRQRAVTFTDRRRQANKTACRRPLTWD